jgi:hypothetical protein
VTELDPTGDPDATRPAPDSPAADPDDAYSQVITAPSRVVRVPPQAGPPAAENLFGSAHRAQPTAVPGPRRGPAGPAWAYGDPVPGAPAPQGFPGAPTPSSSPAGPATHGFPAGPVPPAHDFPAGLGPTAFAPQPGAPGHPWPGYGAPAFGPGTAPTLAAPTWAAGPVPPGGAPPPPGPSPVPPAGRRRWTTILVALVAVVVLVTGGVAVYLTLRGGGGATPAQATRLLADDLESADYASAITRLHPDEVRLGTDLGGMFRDELVRLEILRPDAPRDAGLSGVTFADLRFDDAAVEQVRPGVAIAKLVGGTVTVQRDVGTLPLTDSYKRLAYPNGVPAAAAPEVVDIAEVVADQGRAVRVATVQVDGDWYVSLAYTLADNALVQEGRTWPQSSIGARGAATAQDALRDTVTALFAQDARRLVELAPPHELAVVHDLGPLLVDSAGTPQPTGTRLVDLTTTETAVDGGTALTIDRLVATDAQDGELTIVRDGDCLAVDAAGSPGRVCAADLARDGVASMPGLTDPAVTDVVTRAARAALALRVVVVEDGGQYYVSPVRTVAGVGVDVLHTLAPADLARLAAAGE